MRTLVAVVAALTTVGSVGGGQSLSVEDAPDAVLSEFLTEVSLGAPADSLALRISFYALPGDGRFDASAYLIVEELHWPPSGPEVYVDVDESGMKLSSAAHRQQRGWRASRIDGGLLNQIRRERNVRIQVPGMRDGELGGHWVRPFDMAKWISPRRFVITDGRAFYEIDRVGPGQFDLVSVRSEF